ncbi:MAG: amino acid ABC transporter substrate-binding protein [Bacillales bacterium]|nr:amino acid ABC transporter substrate-binding protein [Bacillales bacterium]
MKKKIWFIVTLLFTFFLGACSPKEGAVSSTDANADSSSKDTKKGVQTIIVGTGTQFPNICFLDKNGKLTGYDVELVREIDKKLPEYQFKFKTMEFSNLLLSLETRKIDFIAHEMEVNKERKAKFLFNKVPYNVFPLKVVVHKDNNNIKSIKDLRGKKVVVSATSNAAVFLEKYNKDHNAGINIVYSGQGSDDTVKQIRTGRADATISTPFAVDFLNKSADAQEKVVGNTLSDSKVYFLFKKDETKLQKRVDEALRELKKEGVVKKLSQKWLGADYSVGF